MTTQTTIRKGSKIRLTRGMHFGPSYLNAGRELTVKAKRSTGRSGAFGPDGRDGTRVLVAVPGYGDSWLQEIAPNGQRTWEATS